MNTPAHVVLGGLALGRGAWRRHWLAITAGALTPDLPMVAFYLYQRLVVGRPEAWIWSTGYFDPRWQAFFDTFNSLPLAALAAGLAWWARSPAGLAFCASLALHCLADLPLHREDAHAHLFPLSSWRFESPVSYWDPRHHGLAFAAVEAVGMVVGAAALARRSRAWRAVAALALASYAALVAFALAVWADG